MIAYLPAWTFTNKRNPEAGYEAVFMIAATPGSNLHTEMGRQAATVGCEAANLLCPVGTMEDCARLKTSPFGPRTHPITKKPDTPHGGVDFGVIEGTAVMAVADGKVIRVADQGNIGYGKYVVLKHDDGSTTAYGHLSKISVKLNDTIRGGQTIALSGNTGGSKGAHLHLTYTPDGRTYETNSKVDPFTCIQGINGEGSLTIRDNGNLADDAFSLYLEGKLIGRTEIGQSNSIGLSNLRSGTKTLKMECLIAPDNEGTYEILLGDGITFSDGSTTREGVIVQGGTTQWQIIIPTKNGRLKHTNPVSRPNKHIEH